MIATHDVSLDKNIDLWLIVMSSTKCTILFIMSFAVLNQINIIIIIIQLINKLFNYELETFTNCILKELLLTILFLFLINGILNWITYFRKFNIKYFSYLQAYKDNSNYYIYIYI